MTNLMISKHFQHFLIIHHKSLIYESFIIEFQFYTLSIIQNERNPAIWFHFFTQASLYVLDDGTINMIVTNNRIDKISDVLHRNTRKYEGNTWKCKYHSLQLLLSYIPCFQYFLFLFHTNMVAYIA